MQAMGERPMLDGKPVRCPPPGDKHELEGCGSYNVSQPDNEGLYECFDCGIWFDEANAREALAGECSGSATCVDHPEGYSAWKGEDDEG